MHSSHPSRIPCTDHSGARDESSGRFDESFGGIRELGASRRRLSPSPLRSFPKFTEGHRDDLRTRAKAEATCASTRCGIGSILFRTGSVDENPFIQTGHNVRKTVRIGPCTPRREFPMRRVALHDTNCAGRLEVMVRVSPQGHTKNTDRPTSSPS